MSTFEIQVYKSGIWSTDSCFDDRDIAMSEAERLDVTARHAGVRILQADYDEASNKSTCRVVFSKSRQSDASQDWRGEAKPASMALTSAANTDRASLPGLRRFSPKRGNASIYIGLAVAFIVFIAGAAAMIGFQEIAKYL